jgi:hypothetical protein
LVGTTSQLGGTDKFAVSAASTSGGSAIVTLYNNDTSVSSDAAPTLNISKGVGTTTSSARFIQFYAGGPQSAGGGATPMGGIVGNGASNVQFASISDAREKTNIQEISGSLSKVLSLKPVEFDWIKDKTHVSAGFVAQDVKQAFPEFVVENMANEGEEQRYGLTGGMTGGIIPHLVKAIQELNAKVEAQAVRIAELEGAK